MKKWIRAAGTALVLSLIVCCIFVCVPFSYAEDESILEPQNGIPLVIIRIDESEEAIAEAEAKAKEKDKDYDFGTIAEMNASKKHSVRCTGTVEIRVPAGYTLPEGAAEWADTELTLEYIRGRGNSTWDSDKKPYKFKLSEKADLFGMGKSKEWAMMANAFDKVLVLNRITSWLGKQMEMPYTPDSVPADFIMVGSDGPVYLGSYTLSETVSIGKNRVAIDELGEQAGDTGEYGETDHQKTGGFLFNIYNDMQKDKPEGDVFTTENGVRFSFEDPEYLEEDSLTEWENEHRGYIHSYLQDVEDLIVGCDTIDQEQHDKIASMIDLKSVADYWLVQEFSKNGDAFMTGSTYFFKPRGGKMQFGPLWDFDLAWGSIDENDEEEVPVSGFNTTHMLWVDELRSKDPEFNELIKQEWQKMDEALGELTESGSILDQYKEELRASYKMNSELYEIPGENMDIDYNFNGLRKWINARREWFNKNIDKVGNIFATVTYIADGETVYVDSKVKIDSFIDEEDLPDAPKKEGYYFTGWFTEDDEPLSGLTIERDMEVHAKYVSESDAVVPEALYLKHYEVWAEVGSWLPVLDDYTVVPGNSISTKITWTSSDESIAAPDEDDDFSLLRPGDVTLTASAINGLTADLTLHVVEEGTLEESDAEGIAVDETEASLITGKSTQVKWHLLPEGKAVNRDYLGLETSDDSVAVVDDNGVITAIGPGTADIIYKVNCGDNEYVTTVKVTVKDPEDPSDAADRAAAMAEAAEKAREEAETAKKDAEAAGKAAEAAKKEAEKARADSEEALRKAEKALAKAETLVKKAEAAQKKAKAAEKAAKAAKKEAEAAASAAGTIHKYGGNTYKILKKATSKTSGTVALTKAKNKKSVKIPATIKILGKKYKVTRINAGAFKGKKIRTVTVGKNVKVIKKNAFKGSKAYRVILKTRLLKKAKVKGCLKGSAVRSVSVKIGKKTVNKKYVKKYRKIFTWTNAGRRPSVK